MYAASEGKAILPFLSPPCIRETLSRADTGQQTIEKETFSFDEAISETLTPLRPVAEANGIALTVTSNEEFTFYGDRKRLIQLIVILADNVLHYTDSGNVRVSATQGERELLITVKLPNAKVNAD